MNRTKDGILFVGLGVVKVWLQLGNLFKARKYNLWTSVIFQGLTENPSTVLDIYELQPKYFWCYLIHVCFVDKIYMILIAIFTGQVAQLENITSNLTDGNVHLIIHIPWKMQHLLAMLLSTPTAWTINVEWNLEKALDFVEVFKWVISFPKILPNFCRHHTT